MKKRKNRKEKYPSSKEEITRRCFLKDISYRTLGAGIVVSGLGSIKSLPKRDTNFTEAKLSTGEMRYRRQDVIKTKNRGICSSIPRIYSKNNKFNQNICIKNAA